MPWEDGGVRSAPPAAAGDDKTRPAGVALDQIESDHKLLYKVGLLAFFLPIFFLVLKFVFFTEPQREDSRLFLLRTSMIDDRFLSILGIPDVYLFAVTFCVT